MENWIPLLPPLVVLFGLFFFKRTLPSLIAGVFCCVLLACIFHKPQFLSLELKTEYSASLAQGQFPQLTLADKNLLEKKLGPLSQQNFDQLKVIKHQKESEWSFKIDNKNYSLQIKKGKLNFQKKSTWDFFTWTWKFLTAKFLSPFNIKILIFLYLLLAFTSLLSYSKSVPRLVTHQVKQLNDPKKVQFSAYLFGIFMFFDGVGSTAVIAGVFSNLGKKVKVSAEKLAYIADTTAAPVAALIPLSTWIAFEISMFQEILDQLKLPSGSAYSYFLESIPFRFYSLFSLIHIPLLIWIGRDWGAMKKCVPQKEEEADSSEDPIQKITYLDYWPIIPLCFLLFGVALGFAISGDFFSHYNVKEMLAKADSGMVLVLISFFCFLSSFLALKFHHKKEIKEIKETIWITWKGVTKGVMILFFAWGLSSGMKQLDTAGALLTLGKPYLIESILPICIFLSGCVISFMSGTAWGTIAILFPIAVPIAYSVGGSFLMIISMGAVLEGAIFGNHTSPFSETTIISSLAAGCSVESHVKTQLPYAFFVVSISLLFGYLPSPQGIPSYICLGGGVLAMVLFYLNLNKSKEEKRS